jgi:hypothetical protein
MKRGARKRRRTTYNCSLPIYMSTRGQQKAEEPKETAFWSKSDEKALVAFLRKEDAANSGGNFKPQVWNAAAAAMPDPERGSKKTAGACKGKWGRVCG